MTGATTLSDLPVCPECQKGRHRDCDGEAFDHAQDRVVECGCDQGACRP